MPALLLHGGPGLPDYMDGCAAELGNLFTTIRYTQRGVAPVDVGGPYTVEAHMADALAILDAFGLEQAWAIGHSWGGHLALHLAVAHPERLYGIVCVDPLGASARCCRSSSGRFREAGARGARPRRRRSRSARAGEATRGGGVLEQLAARLAGVLRRPGSRAAAHPFEHVGVECTPDTLASVDGARRGGDVAEGAARGRDAGAVRPRDRGPAADPRLARDRAS